MLFDGASRHDPASVASQPVLPGPSAGRHVKNVKNRTAWESVTVHALLQSEKACCCL